jgi:aerobic-type carbon monoxide dehydrogenase small subunit (CoxS/CutS family)
VAHLKVSAPRAGGRARVTRCALYAITSTSPEPRSAIAACGAYVLIDGDPVCSCLTAADAVGHEVKDGTPVSPMQAAFVV